MSGCAADEYWKPTCKQFLETERAACGKAETADSAQRAECLACLTGTSEEVKEVYAYCSPTAEGWRRSTSTDRGSIDCPRAWSDMTPPGCCSPLEVNSREA